MDDIENDFLDNVDVVSDIKSAKKPAKDGRKGDEVDAKFGFARFTEGKPRVGFLISMRPVSKFSPAFVKMLFKTHKLNS